MTKSRSLIPARTAGVVVLAGAVVAALATELGLDKGRLAIAWAAAGGPLPTHRPGLALARAVQAITPARPAEIKALRGLL